MKSLAAVAKVHHAVAEADAAVVDVFAILDTQECTATRTSTIAEEILA